MDRMLLMARVRNLLNRTVANGATEAEAATALKAAEKLMAEHDIAIAEAMEAGRFPEFDCVTAEEFGAREPAFLGHVCRVTTAVFGVEVFCRTQRLYNGRKVGVKIDVFGERSKLGPAVWGVGFLCQTFKGLWMRYRFTNRVPSGFSAGYYAGLADGFLANIEGQKDERPTSNAIVKLDAAMQQAFGEAFPGMKREIVKVKADAAAYRQGVQDGRNINLARPIARANPLAIEG